jgi:hypothetical protein
MSFEHSKSAHPEGGELRSFSRTSGRQEMGKTKQYLQSKIPEQ